MMAREQTRTCTSCSRIQVLIDDFLISTVVLANNSVTNDATLS